MLDQSTSCSKSAPDSGGCNKWLTFGLQEGYSSIDYLIYNHQDATQGQKSDWDDADHRNDVLLGLRQRRVLVQSAVQQKKVCVFGGFQAADEYMKSLGWQGEISEESLVRRY